MFDMKEEIEVDPQFIAQLMEQLDVFVSIKPKPKQPSKVGLESGSREPCVISRSVLFAYKYAFAYLWN